MRHQAPYYWSILLTMGWETMVHHTYITRNPGHNKQPQPQAKALQNFPLFMNKQRLLNFSLSAYYVSPHFLFSEIKYANCKTVL